MRYDALERRKRVVGLFFVLGLAALVALAYVGVETSAATALWLFLLVRLLIGFVVAWLVLPIVWFLRRRLRLPKTPAAILYLLLTAAIAGTIFVAL